jgi:hypothetical protein
MQSIIIKKQIAQQKAIERLQLRQADTTNYTTFNQPAALTLTRINTLAVTTAGTTITWESETRNNGFTWSGTDITIPANGYYTVQVAFEIATSVGLNVSRFVNGVGIDMTPPVPAGTYSPLSNTSYYTSGTILQIIVGVGANTTLLVNTENTTNESPIIHIVQLTGVLP